jgi:FAD/FMN-containing dehydrogenase
MPDIFLLTSGDQMPTQRTEDGFRGHATEAAEANQGCVVYGDGSAAMSNSLNVQTIRLITLAGDYVSLERETVEAFARGMRGRLCLPPDPSFDEVRALHNAVIDLRPGLIVQCAGVSDVIKCVNLAREHDLLVSIRGGGHHLSGFASCEGGMMIDLSKMRSVHVDPVRRTARAEPGCTLFDLDTECQVFGLAAPAGIVSNTGAAGLSLGGGLGWLMRSCGLTVDNILDFDIVTADGRLRSVNAEEHPGLYWALRGGGGNFGVVTSFKYRLHPVKTVTAGWIYFPAEKAKEVIEFYRDFFDQAPDRLATWCSLVLLPGAGKMCGISACYNGPPDQAAEAIKPLRQFGVTPILDDIRPMSYLELQSMTDAGPLPGLRYHQTQRFFSKITNELIDAIVANFDVVPGARAESGVRIIAGFQMLGGAVAQVKHDATAFPHRDKKFQFEISAMWDSLVDDAVNTAWVKKFDAELAPLALPGHYINGHMGSGDDFVRESYGEECYRRLAEIKNKFDPRNMFRNNYNIKPAKNFN